MTFISNIQERASDAVIAKVGAGMTYTGSGTAAGSGVVAMAQNTSGGTLYDLTEQQANISAWVFAKRMAAWEG